MRSTSRHYTVTARQGDTWDSLAFRAYMEEREAATIIKANIEMAGTVMFDGGEQIIIPIIDKVTTPETLPPWRRQ